MGAPEMKKIGNQRDAADDISAAKQNEWIRKNS
jgi:hypothetical protein